MKNEKQVSESIKLGILLSLSGGFMDAYSYIERGKVFANAQTGNMLLLGVNIAEGHYSLIIHYLFPILAFVIGIALSEWIHIKQKRLHWRQIAVLIEAMILMSVAFIPYHMNLLANSLTSLACGIQVESFRKINGHSVATTMCIGNLRSGTENMCLFFQTGNIQYLKKVVLYFGIIICFVCGAVLGNLFIHLWHQKAILCCSFLLLLTFIMMFFNKSE